MPLFICRWQNGDFSAVSASSRAEALELLDEVSNADVADVFKAKRFMVHFQLKKQIDDVEDPVPVDLEGFGEETYETLCERVLVTERMRNWDSKKPALSDDPDVAELQQRADVPRPMAEQAVKERRRRAVAEMPPSTDKVQ